MLKKLQLFCITLLSSGIVNSQVLQQAQNTCGTPAPPQQWEDWMGKEVEKYKQARSTGKTQQVVYTIPVVVHIVHFGEAVGTFPNIDSNQVISQIKVLNDDFAGTGLNSTTIPSAFAGVNAGNTGIQFCRARLNPSGGIMPEFGIDRVDATMFNWQNPNTPTLNIVNYMTQVIKAGSMWDAAQYFNIWISDKPPASTVHAFSTYPAGTSLTGLYGGYGIGDNIPTPANPDGVWCWTTDFGTIGNAAPHNKGRTMTHEVGHWLGLRHIWGDGNCLSDYCGDTPQAKQANTGCPPFPSFINRCGTNTSPAGEMTMNFMDRTDDDCMAMFTTEQSIRMVTALGQSPLRALLGTAPQDICSGVSVPSASAIPGFSLTNVPCVGQPFTPINTSSGYPAPTYIWSSTPPAGFSPDPTVPNPAVTFNTPGTYTLTLVATNTVSNGTYSFVVSSVAACSGTPLCVDSLRSIKRTDSLAMYKAPNSTIVTGCANGFAGWITGTNCYKDKEFAQYFPPLSYSATPYPQVNSVIVLFDSVGTKLGSFPGSRVSCKIYGGTVGNGPVSALATKQDSLAYIVATTKTNTIHYIGLPTYTFSLTRVIPYKFDFGPPVIINNPGNGFFAAVEVPSLYPGDSIKIYSDTKYNTSIDSSSWALTFNNVWKPLKSYRGTKIHLAIMPLITCSPIVGIKEEKTAFNSNISIMPNPGTGLFNLIFTLTKEEELFVRIYNSVGQEISSNHLEGVRNNVINLDLSDRPDGIYFTEISNGNERVVKKIIVSH